MMDDRMMQHLDRMERFAEELKQTNALTHNKFVIDGDELLDFLNRLLTELKVGRSIVDSIGTHEGMTDQDRNWLRDMGIEP